MKKTFLIQLFCSFSFLSLAQNKTFKAFLSIKSIDNQNITDDVLGLGRDSSSHKFTGLISPTFTYSKMRPSGKRFVEYQLSNLKAQKTDDVTFLISDSGNSTPRAGGEIIGLYRKFFIDCKRKEIHCMDWRRFTITCGIYTIKT